VTCISHEDPPNDLLGEPKGHGKAESFPDLEQLQEISYLGLTSLKNRKFVQKLNPTD
jgi:hypothetical protein